MAATWKSNIVKRNTVFLYKLYYTKISIALSRLNCCLTHTSIALIQILYFKIKIMLHCYIMLRLWKPPKRLTRNNTIRFSTRTKEGLSMIETLVYVSIMQSFCGMKSGFYQNKYILNIISSIFYWLVTKYVIFFWHNTLKEYCFTKINSTKFSHS